MITLSQTIGQETSHLSPNDSGHKLQSEVWDAYTQMQKAAVADGIDLQIASSYRSFERQLLIWDQKWMGKRDLLSLSSEVINPLELSDTEKLYAILTWSALPGASRHHWGTDLDVFDKQSIDKSGKPLSLIQEEYDVNGPCYALRCWLDEFATDFGFYRPYKRYNGGIAPEPWHLSYKHLAVEAMGVLSQSNLQECIVNTDIGGKPVILENLTDIYNRFVLNTLETP